MCKAALWESTRKIFQCSQSILPPPSYLQQFMNFEQDGIRHKLLMNAFRELLIPGKGHLVYLVTLTVSGLTFMVRTVFFIAEGQIFTSLHRYGTCLTLSASFWSLHSLKGCMHSSNWVLRNRETHKKQSGCVCSFFKLIPSL